MLNISPRALAIAGVVACTGAADAWEFRFQWVRRVGTTDTPLLNNLLRAQPGESVRVRMQFGVFDDGAGPAPAGGYVGWNFGTLVDSDAASGTNTRTPGRLSPFNFAPFSRSNGDPPADPWTSLTQIDNTLGWQSFAWGGIAGTATPAVRPPAIVRGLNTYVSTFEFTTAVGATTYTITAGGNLVAATEWQSSLLTITPDPGEDGIFGPGDFNQNGVDDGADDIAGVSAWNPIIAPPRSFQSVLTVVPLEIVPAPGTVVAIMAAAGLVSGRRRGRSVCMNI
jgi:hypothetical protein